MLSIVFIYRGGGIVFTKEKHNGQCLLKVMFSFTKKPTIMANIGTTIHFNLLDILKRLSKI